MNHRRAVALLVAVGGILPIAIVWRFGALGIPRNDDWSYLLASFRFADGDGIDGNGWAVMNLVGQLVIALPINAAFGNRIAPLQIVVAGLGVVGLVALYDLALQWLTRRRALFAAFLVAVGPMWAALAGSFMTDIPAFSLSMVCLAAGARALSSGARSTVWLLVSLVAGFYGFTIRQYALVAIVAVAVAAVVHRSSIGRRRLFLIIGLSLVTIVGAGGFYLWRLGLPGFDEPPLRAPTSKLIGGGTNSSLRAATLVGVLVTPALLLVGPIRILKTSLRRSPLFIALVSVGTTLTFGLWIMGTRGADFVQRISPGNYVKRTGILGNAVIDGSRRDLVPESILTVLVVVGIASVVVLMIASASAIPGVFQPIDAGGPSNAPARTLSSVALFGFVSAIVVPPLFGMSLFDRYLLPVIALTSALVLGAPVGRGASSRFNRLAAKVALGGLMVFGLVYACNSASFDGARWHAAERASEYAGGRERVDGGFEWINFFAGRQVFFSPERNSPQYCIRLVSSSEPRTGWRGIVEPVWGVLGPQAWIVAEQRSAC